MKSNFTILLALLLLISSFTSAQTTSEENVRFLKSKLFNVGSAEYKLEPMKNGRGIEFVNRSNDVIIQFRLGCVKIKHNRLTILSEENLENTRLDIPTDNKFQTISWSATHGFFPLDECKKGKLAVVEVHLENGKIWKLS